jgi:DNA-binding XRE family transcriptional regulator
MKMTKNFRNTLNEQLRDPQFKKEYDALEPEFQVIRALLDCRKEKNITQKQLSELTGINQADISKLENGNANPSIRTLKRIANAMDMKLKLDFEPIAVGK